MAVLVTGGIAATIGFCLLGPAPFLHIQRLVWDSGKTNTSVFKNDGHFKKDVYPILSQESYQRRDWSRFSQSHFYSNVNSRTCQETVPL